MIIVYGKVIKFVFCIMDYKFCKHLQLVLINILFKILLMTVLLLMSKDSIFFSFY